MFHPHFLDLFFENPHSMADTMRLVSAFKVEQDLQESWREERVDTSLGGIKKLIIVCIVVLTTCFVSFIIGIIKIAEIKPMALLEYIVVVDGSIYIKDDNSTRYLVDKIISGRFLPGFISGALDKSFLLGRHQTFTFCA